MLSDFTYYITLKRIFVIAIQFSLCFLFMMCDNEPERFLYQPEYPLPGQEINISYNPSGILLEEMNEINLTAYCFSRGIPEVKEIAMEKSKKVWHGSFTTTDSTLAVYIVLRSAGKREYIDKNTYSVSLFTNDKNPIRGGLARQAEMAFYGGPCPFMRRDWEMAREYLRKEFEFYPDEVQNLLHSYWYPRDNLPRDSARQIIRRYLEKSGMKKELNRDELSLLFKWHRETEIHTGNYVTDSIERFIDTLSWAMFRGEIIIEKAAEFAETAVGKARMEQKTSKNADRYTPEEWQDKKNQNLIDALDTYGFLLSTLGRIEESIPVFEEAVELDRRQNRAILESYCRSLYEAGRMGKAYNELEFLVKENPWEPEWRTLFEEVYIQWNGSNAGLETIFAKADEAFRLKMKEVIKGQMIEKPAPLFKLNDLEDNIIRLADFKGDIVILDFWATWCRPCIGWFPTMQILVDQYKDDDGVKFFFIDTFEKHEKVVEKVRDLISKNNYTFHVLFDVDSGSVSSVSTAYGLSGIPALFIIDQKGKIRFRPEHGGLNERQFIEQFDIMINLLR